MTKRCIFPAFHTFNSRNDTQFKKNHYLCTEISLKYVFVMARPIRETPVLKGEDAFNFEMRRLEVEHMSKEQRAENRRKFEAQVAEAKKYITVCI